MVVQSKPSSTEDRIKAICEQYTNDPKFNRQRLIKGKFGSSSSTSHPVYTSFASAGEWDPVDVLLGHGRRGMTESSGSIWVMTQYNKNNRWSLITAQPNGRKRRPRDIEYCPPTHGRTVYGQVFKTILSVGDLVAVYISRPGAEPRVTVYTLRNIDVTSGEPKRMVGRLVPIVVATGVLSDNIQLDTGNNTAYGEYQFLCTIKSLVRQAVLVASVPCTVLDFHAVLMGPIQSNILSKVNFGKKAAVDIPCEQLDGYLIDTSGSFRHNEHLRNSFIEENGKIWAHQVPYERTIERVGDALGVTIRGYRNKAVRVIITENTYLAIRSVAPILIPSSFELRASPESWNRFLDTVGATPSVTHFFFRR